MANFGEDHIIRGTAADGMIRALAIDATETVRHAQRCHNATPLATSALGRLMMTAQIMGSLFKVPGELLSLMVRCNGPIGGLTVTADAEGNVKGYAEHPQAGSSATANDVAGIVGQGTLTVVRDSPHVEPYVSQIALVNGTISDDLTAYYILSEQIPTLVGLDMLFDENGQVGRAGGYFIQLMPGYEDNLLMELESIMSGAEPLSSLLARNLAPSEILEELIGPLGFTEYERTNVAFRCDCSRKRCEKTLISLGASEIQDMIDEGKPVTITCDFCNKAYTFSIEELTDLRESLDELH